MALQINTGLTTNDGGEVSSGSYLVFSTTFAPTGYKYSVDFEIYRSENSFKSGYSQVRVNIPTGFSRELTPQEFVSLTPVVINNHVIKFLEEYVGEGNVIFIE